MGRRCTRDSAAADGRPARAGHLLRRTRISGVGRDRRALGAVDRQAVRPDPSAAATYLPNGRAPRSGELFTQPAIWRRSLRRIASDGRAGFLSRPTAAAILECSRERGGTMTADDLARLRSRMGRSDFNHLSRLAVYEIPPNTQGIAALMMLDLMEPFPLREYGFAQRALASRADRSQEAGLRGHAALCRRSAGLARCRSAELLDKAAARARARLIRPGVARRRA